MSSINVKIRPTGDLVLSPSGVVVLESDLSMNAQQVSQMQSVLGVVPGTDVQVFDDHLEDLGGLDAVSGADKFMYSDGSGSWAYGDITTAGRAILDDADADAQRTTLGLAIGSDVQAYSDLLKDVADASFQSVDLIQYDGNNLVRYTVDDLKIALGVSDYTIASVLTENDTTANLELLTMSASTAGFVDAEIFARVDDNNMMAWKAKMFVNRNATGDVAIVSAKNITEEWNSNTLGWGVDFDVSGGVLRANLTGAAATSIAWKVVSRVRPVEHA
jgi:hypothetical protein